MTSSAPEPSPTELLAAAVAEARRGRDEGGVPIGAALVVDGQVIAVGHNRRVQEGSAIKHGETDCLEATGRLPASVYARATMVTTLSPCDMCTGAILLYKIPRVIIGENRTFLGGEELLRSRGVEVVVLDDAECIEADGEFIAREPALWNEDIGEVTPGSDGRYFQRLMNSTVAALTSSGWVARGSAGRPRRRGALRRCC